MNKEILLNVTPNETRAAMLDQGVLQEIFIERSNHLGLVGNVYKGVVQRVLPGMQAAFVDIGLDRTAFLHVADTLEAQKTQVKTELSAESTSINQALRQGQKIVVQVVKDPMGTKGARLTMQLSIPSYYLVFLPYQQCLGISQKIIEPAERARLKQLISSTQENPAHGFIVRTAAEGQSEATLKREIEMLQKQWNEIKALQSEVKPGELIYQGLTLNKRVIRDILSPEVSRMLIDSKTSYKDCLHFAKTYTPDLSDKISYYEGEAPIFELYAVEDEIKKALSRTVTLKSGGYLVIDQTEAMTTVDVNTGTFVGTRNLEETIFKTNLEASQAIARQLRLRNLGGIIILDFIDMTRAEHQEKVIKSLKKYLHTDSAKTTVSDFSSLGLIEMTRKRTRESLEHVLCETCPSCQGMGSIKTVETVCYEIFREIIRVSRLYEAQAFLVLASQSTIDYILDEETDYFAELEGFVGKEVRLQAELMYMQDQYDVVLV